MILVFIEVREGNIKKFSLEALSEGARRASEMGTEANAVLVGHNMETLASEVFPYGASKVYILENTLLSQYSASGYSQALFSLAEEIKPEVILFSASSQGKDLAPRLAAKLGVSLASDCTHTATQNGKLEAVRPIFQSVGGKLEHYYVAYNENTVYLIAEIPDQESLAELIWAFQAGGGPTSIKATPIMTSTEAVDVLKKAATLGYRPPTG